MGEITEGGTIKYIGAFYPQEQDSIDYNNLWKVCAEDLNVVLASHKNFANSTFVEKVVTQFTNNYQSRVALCWDACYALNRALYDGNKDLTDDKLQTAMEKVADEIDGMTGINKEQYWYDINWGGFVADEPIARDHDTDQNIDERIELKCKAVQDAFETVSTNYCWDSDIPTLRKMVVLHREDGGDAWEDAGGDQEFRDRAPDWKDWASKYDVNVWGMDPYIDRVTSPSPGYTDDDAIIEADRDYFYDELVNCLSLESADTHFLAMVGKAFLSKDPQQEKTYDWLTQTQTEYYYDDIQGYSSTHQVDWEDQFITLFWWAYTTDAIKIDPKVESGYEDGSAVKGYIEGISDDEFC